jgi:hypothetical protein
MADELNTPNHRYYQPRYNIQLAKQDFSKQWIFASGIAKIDSFMISPLFAAAEPGVWYDPSDLTTLFQDNAGTTPVTAPGQTVGLMLDKSQGLVLGAELVSSGAAALVGTATAATYSTSTGVGTVSRVDASNQSSVRWSSLNSTSNYKIRVTCTSGNISIRAGDVSTAVLQTLTSGQSFDGFVVPAGGFFTITNAPVVGTSGFTVTSVREIAGNHATQATSTQRPTYGINPITGTRNLLTYSSWSDAVAGTPGTAPTGWGFFLGTGSTSLSGGLDAEGAQAIKFDATVGQRIVYNQSANVVAGNTYSLSADVVAVSGAGTVAISIVSGTAIGTTTAVTNPSTGRRTASYVCTTSGTVGLRLGLGITVGVAGTCSITLTQPQFEVGSTATAYQKVVSQYEVTEAGVQSEQYLQFDGVDDGMVTNTITPAIDKVQVFAGLRMLSSSVNSILAEFSTSSASNIGSFNLQAPLNTNNYRFASRGTLTGSTPSTGNIFVAPVSSVISGTSDISGDLSVLRVNGAEASRVTVDQGTGNYLAYPLYIGRRAGTSVPFNGRLYSLIVRFGANLTDGQITSTEAWVNGKTGAMTWILTQGIWYDDGQWYDTAAWNDGV